MLRRGDTRHISMIALSLRYTGSRSRLAWLLASLAAAIVISSCGGEDLPVCNGPFCVSPPDQAQPANLLPGPTNGQQGAPGRELEQPLQVIVTDKDDLPVSNVTVSFTVSSGGGSLSTTTAESDNQGIAQVRWMLGNEVGDQGVVASAKDEAGTDLDGSPLTLTAHAMRPAPARLVLRSAPPDSALNSIAFEQQPVVEVLDAQDQPIPQVVIVASVASGGGTLTGTTTVNSNEAGLAAYTDLALVGTQGPQTIRFSVADPALEVVSSPIQLIAGTPASLSAVEPLTYEGTV